MESTITVISPRVVPCLGFMDFVVALDDAAMSNREPTSFASNIGIPFHPPEHEN